MEKKQLNGMVAAITILFMPLFSQANDGKINFNGTISNVACVIDSNSANMTVNMGTISRSAFSSIGAVASPTRFDILIRNCPDSVNAVSVAFIGEVDEVNPSLLKLAGGSGAAGIGIALYEADSSTLIPLNMNSREYPIDGTKMENKLTYISKYMSTSNQINSGSAESLVDFTISYR